MSIVIVVGLALLIVIAIAEWNLYKFKKRLGKQASKVKGPKMNNPEITSVSKGIDQNGVDNYNLRSHPSISELPLPPVDRPSNGRSSADDEQRTTNNNNNNTNSGRKFDPANMANKVVEFAKKDKIKEFSFGYLNIAVICGVLIALVILVYYFYSVMGESLNFHRLFFFYRLKGLLPLVFTFSLSLDYICVVCVYCWIYALFVRCQDYRLSQVFAF